jgi:hypothetical protein
MDPDLFFLVLVPTIQRLAVAHNGCVAWKYIAKEALIDVAKSRTQLASGMRGIQVVPGRGMMPAIERDSLVRLAGKNMPCGTLAFLVESLRLHVVPFGLGDGVEVITRVGCEIAVDRNGRHFGLGGGKNKTSDILLGIASLFGEFTVGVKCIEVVRDHGGRFSFGTRSKAQMCSRMGKARPHVLVYIA